MRVPGGRSPGDPGPPAASPEPSGLQAPACSAAGVVTSGAALSLGRLCPDVGPFPSPEGKNGGAAAGRAGSRRAASATICSRVAAPGSPARPGALGEMVMKPGGPWGGRFNRLRTGQAAAGCGGRAGPRRAGASQLRGGSGTRLRLELEAPAVWQRLSTGWLCPPSGAGS